MLEIPNLEFYAAHAYNQVDSVALELIAEPTSFGFLILGHGDILR